MKKLIAASLVTLTMVAGLAVAPAIGDPSRKTELVELGGKSVDRLVIPYAMDAAWLVDNKNILYRDDHRDNYLVTLKVECSQLEVRGRSFSFHPAGAPSLQASRAYEVRPDAGQWCDVAKVEQVDDAKADAMREAAFRRIW